MSASLQALPSNRLGNVEATDAPSGVLKNTSLAPAQDHFGQSSLLPARPATELLGLPAMDQTTVTRDRCIEFTRIVNLLLWKKVLLQIRLIFLLQDKLERVSSQQRSVPLEPITPAPREDAEVDNESWLEDIFQTMLMFFSMRA